MADVDIHYDPISVHADATSVEIKGLDNTKNTIVLETPQPVRGETTAELAITQPIRIESKGELVIPQPIRIESAAQLDVKPVVLDQCLNIRLGPLPPTCVRLPYQQHIGFTLFGVEIFGFNFVGESQLHVAEPPSAPQIAYGGEQALVQAPPAPAGAPVEPGGGLRIRLGG
ncbi:MAG TPA: hypothetical protein VF897_11175 [Roseiflexaceae bacterium]